MTTDVPAADVIDALAKKLGDAHVEAAATFIALSHTQESLTVALGQLRDSLDEIERLRKQIAEYVARDENAKMMEAVASTNILPTPDPETVVSLPGVDAPIHAADR